MVARAATEGHRVRASGAGHSFSEIALTEGVMVRLDRLDRVLDFDRASGRMKVEAGIVLGDLNLRLDELGVAFANLGDIDRQTVAGSISTATHGTGRRFRNVSAQVAAIELVLADGSTVELDAASDAQGLRAARVGLGALGVIGAVTIETVPAYTINRTDRPRPLGEVLSGLDELNAANDHFEFYVFPHTRTALCRESRRTDEPPCPRGRALTYLQEVALENWVAQLFVLGARRAPAQAPRLARLAARGSGRSRKVDRSHRVFASERRIRFTEMEYGIPVERAVEAVRGVIEIASRPAHGVSFPIEVRFVAADDAFLSPSFERDTCYIAVHHDRKLDWRPYLREVETLMRGLEGRPHWGKRHSLGADELAPLYPGWEEFQRVRARLDPGGVFTNDYTDHVLGPVDEAHRKARPSPR